MALLVGAIAFNAGIENIWEVVPPASKPMTRAQAAWKLGKGALEVGLGLLTVRAGVVSIVNLFKNS